MTKLFVLTVYVPDTAAAQIRTVLAEAGAGALGEYWGCSFSLQGTGRFTPLDGANPAIGAIGAQEEVSEVRIEVVVSADNARAVVEQLLEAHPYEEPAYYVVPMLTLENL